MKEKPLMTSFLAVNFLDIATTAYGVGVGFQEVGFYGKGAVESGNIDNAFLLRTAVTAIYIGTYALAEKYGSKFAFPIEKSMQIANVIAWGVAVFNVIQVAPHLFS